MISFFSTESAKDWVKVEDRKAWVQKVADYHSASLGVLSFILNSDAELRAMNKQFLAHDYETDVLTFDLSKEGSSYIEGEIYISIDRVEAQASHYGVSIDDELDRVLIHGLLHLIGFDDIEASDKAKMTQAEDEALRLRSWNGY